MTRSTWRALGSRFSLLNKEERLAFPLFYPVSAGTRGLNIEDESPSLANGLSQIPPPAVPLFFTLVSNPSPLLRSLPGEPAPLRLNSIVFS